MLGWVHVGLGEENGALVGGHFKLGVGVLPEELHIIPMLYDSVLDRVAQLV